MVAHGRGRTLVHAHNLWPLFLLYLSIAVVGVGRRTGRARAQEAQQTAMQTRFIK